MTGNDTPQEPMKEATHGAIPPADTEPVVHPDVTFSRLEEAILAGENTGYCIDCGAETDGVEPDAERYPCHECGATTVYGADQLILLELFH